MINIFRRKNSWGAHVSSLSRWTWQWGTETDRWQGKHYQCISHLSVRPGSRTELDGSSLKIDCIKPGVSWWRENYVHGLLGCFSPIPHPLKTPQGLEQRCCKRDNINSVLSLNSSLILKVTACFPLRIFSFLFIYFNIAFEEEELYGVRALVLPWKKTMELVGWEWSLTPWSFQIQARFGL